MRDVQLCHIGGTGNREPGRNRPGRRGAALGAVTLALVLVATACAQGTHPGAASSVPTGQTSGAGPGLTSSTITIGNVSTVGGLVPGLFEGARYGVEAYAAYLNSQGGVDGRKLEVDAGDDALSCTQNRQQVLSQLANVVAFVGSFSLFDYCGDAVVPHSVPLVAVSTDTALNAQTNFFSPQPMQHGWLTGALMWFKQHYPKAVLHVGALVAGVAPAPASWAAEEAAMRSLGYHVSVVYNYEPLTTQFTSDVIGMEQAGVQMVVLDQADVATIARFVDAMQAQGFHPPVVTSSGTAYDATFIQQAGATAAETVTSAQTQSLYLGQDAASIPAVKTFDHWYSVVFPGHQPDIYALYGWASAELFVQAVRAAGSHLDRQTIEAALSKVTSFDADGMLPVADPAGKKPATCFLLAHVVNGQWQRIEPATGFDCSGGYYLVPGS